MLSPETAVKLKEAGLQWEYEYGFPKDCVYYKGKLHEVDGPGADNTFRLAPWGNYVKQEYIIFCPRLDQMLAEIEKRDYWWQTKQFCKGLNKSYIVTIVNSNCIERRFQFSSPEEAAAQALLWIMEQEGAK